MRSLWQRTRVWLWRLEPRPEPRMVLQYDRMCNRHRSRRWRRNFALSQFDAPTSFAAIRITRPPESHPTTDRPTRYPDFDEEPRP